MEPLIGGDPPRIGPYRLLARLGAGGMGQVYLAVSPGGRTVALKVVRPDLADDPTFRTRFEREVAAARTVSGAFALPVLDGETDGPMPWLATAYIAGPSLHDAVAEHGPLPVAALRALCAGLAEALVAIHSAGLVHRDLKPSNVLIAGDGPRVIDFGIARATDGTALTGTGTVIGSPGYMSPEQIAHGRDIGPPSDVFSLGAVLVFAATGRGAFGTGAAPALLYRVIHHEPRLAGVPDALRPLVAGCLEKDPSRRPTPEMLLNLLDDGPAVDPDALLTPGLRADLDRRAGEATAYEAAPIRATRPTLVQGRPAGRRRFLGIAAGTVAGLSAVGGVTAWAVDSAGPRPRPRPTPPAPTSSAGLIGEATGPAPRWTFTPAEGGGAADQPIALTGRVACFGATTLYGVDPGSGEQKWSVANAGWGPLIAVGDVVYGDGPAAKLFAVDAATGRTDAVLDLTKAGIGNITEIRAVTGGSIYLIGSASPSGAGDVLYAIDQREKKVRWSHPFGDGVSSPAVAATPDACFVRDGDALHALDARTGARRWQVPAKLEDSPTLRLTGGILLTSTARGLTARTTAGATMWTLSATATGQFAPIAIAGEFVYTTAGDSVYAAAVRSGALRWRGRAPASLRASGVTTLSLAASAEVVAAEIDPGTGAAGFTVLGAADGKVRWTRRTSGDTETHWRLAAQGTTVFAGDGSTRLYAFDARRRQ